MLGVGDGGHAPAATRMRLWGWAKKHELALWFLTRKRHDAGSLGTLVSLSAEARREQTRVVPAEARPVGVSAFTCTARVLKDKRGGPGWSHVEVCRGPNGLC